MHDHMVGLPYSSRLKAIGCEPLILNEIAVKLKGQLKSVSWDLTKLPLLFTGRY